MGVFFLLMICNVLNLNFLSDCFCKSNLPNTDVLKMFLMSVSIFILLIQKLEEARRHTRKKNTHTHKEKQKNRNQ